MYVCWFLSWPIHILNMEQGLNQRPAKSSCIFASSIQWYGLLSIWWQDFGTHKSTMDCIVLSLMCTQLLISWFWANGPMGGGWGEEGWGGDLCSFSTVCHGSWEVHCFKDGHVISIVYSKLLLSPISGRGLWLYASAKYPTPQWYSKTLARPA